MMGEYDNSASTALPWNVFTDLCHCMVSIFSHILTVIVNIANEIVLSLLSALLDTHNEEEQKFPKGSTLLRSFTFFWNLK